MCHITSVLETLRKKRTITNKDIVALGEAQAADTMEHKREHKEMVERMTKLESDVAMIKESQIKQEKVQIEHGAKLDLIIQRLNSPVEEEREAGQKWNLLVSITKHKAAWVILALVLLAFALAGDRMASVVGDIIRKLIGA